MKILAYVIVIAILPLSLFAGQNNPNSPPQTQASDGPVIYTLEFDEEMIEALRAGKSLVSIVPESIRGQVDKVRIEYKPSATKPASQSPASGNSIYNQDKSNALPARFDTSSFGKPTGFDESAPPLTRPTSAASDLPRSAGSYQQGTSTQAPSAFNFNRTSNQKQLQPPAQSGSILQNSGSSNRVADSGFSNLTKPSRSLTPVNENGGWMLPTRSDSNTTLMTGPNTVGLPTSQPAPYNSGLNRSTIESSSPSYGSISAPPVSRSIPILGESQYSQGMATSNPPPMHSPADNQPGWDANRSLSKIPAETYSSALLGASDAATRADNRTLSYLFMMLLCSIGLNVYLGWISRGFYVRYHELAAELRETFTPGNAA